MSLSHGMDQRVDCGGLIEPAPVNWQALQERVATILSECGMVVKIEKDVQTVRGIVNIDVHAEDNEVSPPATYLCECKNWQKRVPKSVIHGLRTVVADTGANWGMVISAADFQSGAYAAAQSSNVHLKNWSGFQQIFKTRWWHKYAVPKLRLLVDRASNYRNPFSSQDQFFRIQRLTKAEYDDYHKLIAEHADVIDYADLLTTHYPFQLPMPELPIHPPIALPLGGEHIVTLPCEVLELVYLRGFVNVLCRLVYESAAKFEILFAPYSD